MIGGGNELYLLRHNLQAKFLHCLAELLEVDLSSVLDIVVLECFDKALFFGLVSPCFKGKPVPELFLETKPTKGRETTYSSKSDINLLL